MLQPLVRQVVAELGAYATVEKVNDDRDMLSYGLMGLTGFAVDGKVLGVEISLRPVPWPCQRPGCAVIYQHGVIFP